jgi:hypothetical protein
MKKIVLFSILAFFSLSEVKSQDNSESCVAEGNTIINAYYGLSVISSVYKSVIPKEVEGLKFSSIGPVGVVFEHLVTDVIGLGAEFGYRQINASYTEASSNGSGQNYTSSVQFTTIRAMFRANFHFSTSEKFDAYALVSAGYKNNKFTFSTNDPNNSGSLSFGGILPFGIKPGIGLRYFFTKNIGLNLEFAAGSPLMCGGLSLKF